MLWEATLAAVDRGRPRASRRLHAPRPDGPAATSAPSAVHARDRPLRARSGWSRRAHRPRAHPHRAPRAEPAPSRRLGPQRPADLGAHPRPRPAPGHARRGDRLRPRPDLPPLGAVPGRRRLHQPRDHRRPRAPRRLRPPHPPHPPRHRPAASPHATNTALAPATGDYIALLDHDDTLTPDALAARRRPHRRRTRPRHDLQRRGHRPGRPAGLGASQARRGRRTRCAPTATRAISASTAARWCRRSAGFAPSSTAPRTST